MNSEIFDAHIHINNTTMSVEKCLQEMQQNSISDAIVMPDPIDPKIYSLNTTNKDVSAGGVRIKFTRDAKGFYVVNAVGLGISGGKLPDDYWFKINENLIKACEGKQNLFPYVLLPVNTEVAKEILFRLEKEYYGKFFGLKFHPNAYSYPVHRITLKENKPNAPIDYPIIIHTGISRFDHPKNALKFAKTYAGNVCLAHCACFEHETLLAIAKQKNVYIDISPSYYLTTISQGTAQKVFNKDLLKGKTPTELLLKLVDIVGEDRILAGSDTPYGNIEGYKTLSDSLEIPESLKSKIFKENVKNFNNKAYLKNLSQDELQEDFKTSKLQKDSLSKEIK